MLVFRILAAAAQAFQAFCTKFKVSKPSDFVGANNDFIKTALAPESVWDRMVTVDQGLLDGTLFRPPKKKKAEGDEGKSDEKGFTRSLAKVLLMPPIGAQLFNFRDQVKLLDRITNGKTEQATVWKNEVGHIKRVACVIEALLRDTILTGLQADWKAGFSDTPRQPNANSVFKPDSTLVKFISLISMPYYDFVTTLSGGWDNSDDGYSFIVENLNCFVTPPNAKGGALFELMGAKKVVNLERLRLAPIYGLTKGKVRLALDCKPAARALRAPTEVVNVAGVVTRAGFPIVIQRHFPNYGLLDNPVEDEDESEMSKADLAKKAEEDEKNAYLHRNQIAGQRVSVAQIKCPFEKLLTDDSIDWFNSEVCKHYTKKDVKLMVVDPNWGLNTDKTLFGGIDQRGERWNRCNFL